MYVTLRSLRIAFFIISLATLFPLVARAQEPVRMLTLQQAIERALQVDPAAVAAETGVSAADATLLQTRGAWLPTLTLNSGYANSSNERFDQATGQLVSESYTAQAAYSYDLFTGGRWMAEHRSARAEVRAVGAELRAQRFRTIRDTKQSFYAASATEELVRVAEQRLERARQQLTFAQTRLEVGTATRSDVLRAELEVGNAELAVVDAQSALRSARLQLGRQVGIEDEVRPALGALPESAPSLPPAELLAQRSQTGAPSVIAARAGLEASRAGTRAAVSPYLPTLRTSGGYDWFAFDFPPEQRSWSVRVFASYPLFNGFQREAALMRARARERAAEARARDAEIGARNAAEDAAREAEVAGRRLEIARRAVELAREDLRVQEERYRIGAATILDLQTSQLALAEAEVAEVRAREALGVAVAELEAVLGEALEDIS